MKKLLIIPIGALLMAAGCLLVPSERAEAQDNQQITSEELMQYVGEKGVYRTRSSRRVTGTPYLNKDWKMGYIMLSEKSKSEDLPLRLNTYEQEIEFARGEEVFAIAPNRVKGFVIYNEFGNILFKNGYRSEDHDVTPSTLLRVVHDGRTKLLVHHVTNLQKDMASYGMASKLDEYIDDRHYYLVKADGTWEEIRLRRRDVVRQLEDHGDELEQFARSNNLDFGEEPELARILQHYDSLLQQDSGSDSGGSR